MQNTILGENRGKKTHDAEAFMIAVGGGKGGIGKSFFASNFAVALSRKYRVCIVDLDLGSSNLHTYLGIKNSTTTLSDHLHSNAPLNDLVCTTNFKNLWALSGAYDHLQVSELEKHKVPHLITNLKNLPYDYIILDLGAGCNYSTVEFFLAAHLSLIVTSPDPASIENAYRFMKTAFYNKILSLDTKSGIKKIISEIMSHRDQFAVKSPAQLVKQVMQESPLCGKILDYHLKQQHWGIIMNQARTGMDAKIGNNISRICRQYFALDCSYYGSISHDDTVWQSLRKCKPVLQSHPYSNVSNEILKITYNLVGSQIKSAVV